MNENEERYWDGWYSPSDVLEALREQKKIRYRGDVYDLEKFADYATDHLSSRRYIWPRYKAPEGLKTGNRIWVRDRVRIQSDGQMPFDDGCEGVVEGITFFCCDDDDSGGIGVEIVVCEDGDDKWTRVLPEHLEEL